jgi:hypothetical protein
MMVEAYRRMTPAQKFGRIQALNESVLQTAAARIRQQYESATERELQLRLAALCGSERRAAPLRRPGPR